MADAAGVAAQIKPFWETVRASNTALQILKSPLCYLRRLVNEDAVILNALVKLLPHRLFIRCFFMFP
nr:MAG TPA: hypothetical protein [Caudoviricetes sp.]